MQFVIKTTEPFQNLNEVAQAVLDKAQAERHVLLRRHRPQDRQAADRRSRSTATWSPTLGLTQQDVGAALGAALGGGYVNYFSIAGRSYKVIPQVLQVDRLNPSQVLDYYIAHAGRRADAGLDGRAR